HRPLAPLPGPARRPAGGDLDDAVAAGLGVAADGRVQRLRGGAVDGRVGETALLGPVEHLVVHVGGGDRHGDAPRAGAGVSWRTVSSQPPSPGTPNLTVPPPGGQESAQALVLLAAGQA